MLLRATALIAASSIAFAVIACGSDAGDALIRSTRAGGGGNDGQPEYLPDGAVNPSYCSNGQTECTSGVCVDLATDNSNCGSCGAVCGGGGTCTAGRCIVKIASGGNGSAISVDASRVYFTGSSGLMSVPVGGGAVTTLAPGATGPFALDASHVYYSTANGVMSIPLAGGTPTQLGIYPAVAMTANGKGVCWTTGTGEVVSVPAPDATTVADGGALDDAGDPDAGAPPPPPPTTLAIGQYQSGTMAADSKSLFWTTQGVLASGGGYSPGSGTVMRFDFPAVVDDDGGTPDAGDDGGGPTAMTVSAGQNQPFALALDGANVYWTNAGTSADGYVNGSVMRAPLAGGAPVAVATGQSYPYGLALDATTVYWVAFGGGTNSGALMSAPIAGGTPSTLESGLASPTFVAVDADSIYWTTSTGDIMKATPK